MTITLLKTLGPLVATKKIRGYDDKGLIDDYSHAKNFEWSVQEVNDIEALALLLEQLRSDPKFFVIHGVPNHTRRITTKKWNPASDFYPELPEIKDCLTNWVMFDFDKRHLDKPGENIYETSEMFISAMPEEFHNVSYYSTYSSSTGVNPSNWTQASVHIWMMLKTPMLAADLFKWGKAFVEHNVRTYGDSIIDHCVLNISQPNYTADPIFIGVPNPVKRRSILVEKDNPSVILPDIPVYIPQKHKNSGKYGNSTPDFEDRLNEQLEKIGSGGKGKYYYNLFGSFSWYVKSCHSRGVDPDKSYIIGKVAAKVSIGRPEYVKFLDYEYDKAYATTEQPKLSEEEVRQRNEELRIKGEKEKIQDYLKRYRELGSTNPPINQNNF